MKNHIGYKTLLLIALVCIILEYVFDKILNSTIIAGGLGILGLITLVSGIAGYIKHKKSLKNIEISKENK